MKTGAVYENLDTSFVNLAALLRFLRERKFVGRVRFEQSHYKAEIFLLENNRTKIRENARSAQNAGEGKEMLQRIFQRAAQPNGIINVYRIAETKEAKPISVTEENRSAASAKKTGNENLKNQTHGAANSSLKSNSENHKPEAPKTLVKTSNFPFTLSNRVETNAEQTRLAPDEWHTFLRLIVELLGTIEKSLAEANLDFTAAFKKAAAEISGDYPFLDPSQEIFAYAYGKLSMRKQVNPKVFTAAVNEILRRLLKKLGANPKFSEAHRQTSQKILALVHHRKPLYDKFFITPQLEKILGV